MIDESIVHDFDAIQYRIITALVRIPKGPSYSVVRCALLEAERAVVEATADIYTQLYTRAKLDIEHLTNKEYVAELPMA